MTIFVMYYMQKTFECTDNSTVPLYIKIDCSKKQQVRKFSPFVEVSHNGKVFHIRKSTAVWLFQECERVSTDRLYRVRSKQPYSSSTKTISSQAKTNSPQVFTLPTKLQNIQIGDICVFSMQGRRKIGKVLQFHFDEGKTQKAQQCSQTYFDLATNSKKVAVVCSWFSWHPPLSLQTFSLGNNEKDLSQSYPINNYVFTLSSRCFQLLQMEKPDGIVPQGILTNDVVKVELLCAKLITLSEESLLYIEKTFQADSCHSASISNVKPGSVTTGSKYNGIWKNMVVLF